jgi:hypothetical protein
MERQPSRIRYAELDYQAKSGELLSRLRNAGHRPKITIELIGEREAVNYRIRLMCINCLQTRRKWPSRLWSGLSPNRQCPGANQQIRISAA